MALLDPGFCKLAERCQAVAPNGMRCLTDGSVALRGERLDATARCSWRPEGEEEPRPPTGDDHCEAATLIQSVRDGSIGRDQLELVIARFDEDIKWSEPYNKVRTVYEKGSKAHAAAAAAAAASDAVPSDEDDKGRFVQLPNVGLEQHSYLEHIVRNYDHLASRTVFMLAARHHAASSLQNVVRSVAI